MVAPLLPAPRPRVRGARASTPYPGSHPARAADGRAAAPPAAGRVVPAAPAAGCGSGVLALATSVGRITSSAASGPGAAMRSRSIRTADAPISYFETRIVLSGG